jgi:hypothetical protein
MKRKYFFLQVKNKPRVGGTKHEFILGSMDNMFANNHLVY